MASSDSSVSIFVAGSTQPFITDPFYLPGTVDPETGIGTPRDLSTWVGTMYYRKDSDTGAPSTITGAQVVGDASGVITVTPAPDEIVEEGYYTGRITSDDLAVSPTLRVTSAVFRFRVDPILPLVQG